MNLLKSNVMTAIDLYKFITENDIEFHWVDDEVFMFVYIFDIDEFYKLFTSTIFDDEGITCTMKYGYFCFKMKDICEYYGIDLTEVFKNEN